LSAVQAFSIARLPRIEYGRGAVAGLPAIVARFGRKALIVTGARSFQATPHRPDLHRAFAAQGIAWETCLVAGEPSPELVDAAAREHAGSGIDVVVGIGGGSALDAAKAIAGLLRVGRSVLDYLEGVGPELPYAGPAVPFVAVPTTAGTGSEATKNAVLSRHGAEGFKKSFRDDRLVAECAVVDPQLLASCPRELIAANGMDALTQLLESYVSTRANPYTDALAESGLAAVRDGLLEWYREGSGAVAGQDRMAYAALLSGVALAQTGLGSVHGLASPLGAYFPIPHGVACGTTVASATALNLRAMRDREPANPALSKYARAAEILRGRAFDTLDAAHAALVDLLEAWTEAMALPRLSHYGVAECDVGRLVAGSRGSSMKTNPIVLRDDEVAELVRSRL
jgi:alcohol dehydrogenase